VFLRQGEHAAITISEFLTVGYCYPPIPDHRRTRSRSHHSSFARKNPRSGKRWPRLPVRVSRHRRRQPQAL